MTPWWVTVGLLVAHILTVHGAAVIINNDCLTDNDCRLMNGVCMDARADGAHARCSCAPGFTWDQERSWCDTEDRLATNTLGLTFQLLYEEQVDSSNRWLSTGTFPRVWKCRGDFCSSRTPTAWLTTFNGSRILELNSTLTPLWHLYGVYQNGTMSMTSVDIQCDRDSGFYYYKKNDVAGGTGQEAFRPLDEHCVLASEIPTVIDNDAQRPLSMADTWPNVTNTPCVHDADCPLNQTCYDQGGCFCTRGFYPTSTHTCMTGSTGTYRGAPLEETPWHSLDVTFSLATPRLAWIETPYVTHAISLPAAVDTQSDMWRIPQQRVRHWWACKRNDTFFPSPLVDLLSTDLLALDAHCQGGNVTCGEHGYPLAPRTGSCVCDANWDGPACDRCAEGMAGVACNWTQAVCNEVACSGNGQCRASWSVQDQAECVCEPLYSAHSDCSQFWSGQSDGACSMSGIVDPATLACQCLPGYFGLNCEWSGVSCALDRCSGHGRCATQLQACDCSFGWDAVANCSIRACYGEGSTLQFPQWPESPCVCGPGLTGDFCEHLSCLHGGVIGADGVCVCRDGWALDPVTKLCSVNTCGGPSLGYANSLTGKCVCFDPLATGGGDEPCHPRCDATGTHNVTNNACVCLPGFTGSTCALRLYVEILDLSTPWWFQLTLSIIGTLLVVFGGIWLYIVRNEINSTK